MSDDTTPQPASEIVQVMTDFESMGHAQFQQQVIKLIGRYYPGAPLGRRSQLLFALFGLAKVAGALLTLLRLSDPKRYADDVRVVARMAVTRADHDFQAYQRMAVEQAPHATRN